jgi:hypothetical protein
LIRRRATGECDRYGRRKNLSPHVGYAPQSP